MKMAKIGQLDITTRQVTLQGFTPIMFDRYPGDNKTVLPVEKKFYFMPNGASLCLPASNIVSFLSATNTNSAAKLAGGRGYKTLANALLSFVVIEPAQIPLTRNGEPVRFHGFTDDRDEQGGIYVDRRVARLDKGIPNPKERPVVELPWELSFSFRMFKNDTFDEELLKTIFTRGGIALGLGTFRGVFGKFLISRWE